jgi:citronellol/citronellal dehydrogenase
MSHLSPPASDTATYQSIFRSELFAGKAYVITGGGSGIGLTLAKELTSLGARVALIGRDAGKLERARESFGESRKQTFAYTCDIRDEQGVTETVSRALFDLKRIDGLVNNAGGQFFSPAEAISANGWDAVVRNNLTGGFLMAREVYRQYMKGQNGGVIVNMLADMWMGMPGMAHSGAARAGMLNLTETLAYEWAPTRVNAVAPGWIASSGLETYPDKYRPMINRFPSLVPAGRLGTEAEVAAAITFLLSPAAAFISGSIIRIDGAVPNRREHWEVAVHGATAPFNGDAADAGGHVQPEGAAA